MKRIEGQDPPAETLVTITGTGKSKHLPKGSTFEVPPAEAEHLISLGRAKKGGTIDESVAEPENITAEEVVQIQTEPETLAEKNNPTPDLPEEETKEKKEVAPVREKVQQKHTPKKAK